LPAEMRQITRREDLQELHAITKSLIGQECWQAILTYPSQLQLHWGERVAYESERLRGEYRGTWVFGAESSRWTLQCRDKAMVSSDDYDSTIKRTIRILAGGMTEEFEVAYPQLTVTVRFNNGCTILLVSDPDWAIEAAEEDPIPDWELFCPDGMWLGVGRGPKYRFQKADQPLD